MDKFGYVTGESGDVALVAVQLRANMSLRIVWTDSRGFACPIYFVPSATLDSYYDTTSHTTRWRDSGMVVVSMEKLGCFHLNLLNRGGKEFSGEYVAEKLGVDKGHTANKLAEFLTAISRFEA